MKWISAFFSLLFVVAISVPFARYLSQPAQEVSEDEKRDLAPFPEVDFRLLDQFPPAFNKHWADQFGYRDWLIKKNHEIKMDVLRISPVPNLVLLGEDQWYFMKGKSYKSYTGLNKFRHEHLKRGRAELQRRADFAKKAGIPYYIFIAPLKHRVYDDKLPMSIIHFTDSMQVDQFVQLGKEIDGIEVIDLAPVLREHKDERRLYHKTDNHWNNQGGLVAYQEMIRTMQQDFPNIPDAYTWEDFDIKTREGRGGALARYLKKKDELKEEYFDLHPVVQPSFQIFADTAEKFEHPEGFWYPDEYEIRTVTDRDSTLPRIVWFRDSFGRMMYRHFRQHFSYTTEIFDSWMYRANEHILVEEQPDAIVVLVLERNIQCLLLGGNCEGNF